MIAIIDYRMGNLGSIRNMLKKIGHGSVVTSDPDEIRQARKLILPGVGAFDNGMTHIREMGLEPLLNELVLQQHRVFHPVVAVQLVDNELGIYVYLGGGHLQPEELLQRAPDRPVLRYVVGLLAYEFLYLRELLPVLAGPQVGRACRAGLDVN